MSVSTPSLIASKLAAWNSVSSLMKSSESLSPPPSLPGFGEIARGGRLVGVFEDDVVELVQDVVELQRIEAELDDIEGDLLGVVLEVDRDLVLVELQVLGEQIRERIADAIEIMSEFEEVVIELVCEEFVEAVELVEKNRRPWP